MGSGDARLCQMMAQWCELDEAMLVSGEWGTPAGVWPWLSESPRVIAAWAALTRPEHLPELEFRLAHYDDVAAMTDWAAAVTRKAIEISRSRT